MVFYTYLSPVVIFSSLHFLLSLPLAQPPLKYTAAPQLFDNVRMRRRRRRTNTLCVCMQASLCMCKTCIQAQISAIQERRQGANMYVQTCFCTCSGRCTFHAVWVCMFVCSCLGWGVEMLQEANTHISLRGWQHQGSGRWKYKYIYIPTHLCSALESSYDGG